MKSLVKKFLIGGYKIIKLTFSILKTKLLMLGNSTFKDKKYKSSSEYIDYPELALKAALDFRTFNVFRRHHKYNRVLEHVNRKNGEAYLKIIRDKYKLKDDDIFDIIKPLMKVGNPKLLKLNGLSKRISTTGLRYLKIALDIKELTGNNIGHVVEIGCGYGGQAIILDRLLDIDSYTFYDLWQVNLLIKRFIENSNFSSKYTLSTIREDSYKKRNKWDFCISNYAFSEFPMELQKLYLKKIIKNSKSGYMLMNSGVSGEENWDNIKNFSQKDLLQSLNNAKIEDEIPLTYKHNYLCTWNTNN